MEDKPNIVMLTVDCMRPDHLGIYGYDRPTSPAMDGIARKGIVFDRVLTCGPNTPPSFNSLFTSTYPFSGEGYHPLPGSKIPVAEVLNGEGYTTIGVNSNAFLTGIYKFNRGFDIYKELFREKSGLERFVDSKISALRYRKWNDTALRLAYLRDRFVVRDIRPYLPGNHVVDTMMKEISKVRGRFFTWAHFMDAHMPLQANNEGLREMGIEEFSRSEVSSLRKWIANRKKETPERTIERIKDLYDSNIRFIDGQISRIVDHIDERWENTVVMILSDHGEEFKEHGHFGHFGKLYDELLRIPLIIKGPGLPMGHREHRIISNIDISPMLLATIGIRPPRLWQGNKIDLKSDDGKPWRKYVISQVEMKSKKAFGNKAGKKISSIRDDRYKLIESQDSSLIELYDLLKDPGEENDISGIETQVLKEMRLLLKEINEGSPSRDEDMEKVRLKGALSKIKL
ncbi:MAG: sulfatase [Thermoplasmatota archaeon]